MGRPIRNPTHPANLCLRSALQGLPGGIGVVVHKPQDDTNKLQSDAHGPKSASIPNTEAPMAELITLITHLEGHDPPGAVPPLAGFDVRPCGPSDLHQLGGLYFEAYDPGIACDTLDEAIADIEASFQGDYGEFWYQASPVIEANGRIVSAVMTVRQAPWDDTPDGPFIIELFTARDYRRRGLARLVIRHCLNTIRQAGETTVALRVAANNTPARNLYQSLGFAATPPPH